MIIYNSKVPTTSFLDYKKGWNHDPIRVLNGKGDGTVPAIGIRYACENWSSEKRPLICLDLEKNDPKNFEHGALTSNPFVLSMIYNATIGNAENGQKQWWEETGKLDLHIENDRVEKIH